MGYVLDLIHPSPRPVFWYHKAFNAPFLVSKRKNVVSERERSPE
jgi:hypothetical protein